MPSSHRPRIGILGTPVTSGNRGVLALGASLMTLCRRAQADIAPFLLIGRNSHDPAPFFCNGQREDIPVVPCRLSPRSRPSDHFLWILLASILYRLLPPLRPLLARVTPWIAALRDARWVGDIRGGDSFSDIYGFRRFFLGSLMAWTVILVRGSITQFPQTYGPFKSAPARGIARFLLRRSYPIIARDRESQRIAQELAGPSRTVLLSPDVAFALPPAAPTQPVFDPPGVLQPGTIGLNVNGLMFHGGYTGNNMFGLRLDYARFLPRLVEALLDAQPGDLLLVPHTYAPKGDVESDNAACESVRNTIRPDLRPRLRLIQKEYDAHELKGLIGQCDFFVGSRMHSCIAALSQGVPCVGVAYSMKFAGVFDSVGMRDWIVDGRDTDTDTAIRRILELYQVREDARPGLRSRASEARHTLDQVFTNMLSATAPLPRN
jgi:polysaccharide pyruvyl transferase WcaK-like protein